MGYRHYDRSEVKPRFAFGYGLSYTDFEYSGLKVSPVKGKDCCYKVSFSVENTGAMDGAETAQVYVRPISPEVERPYKELKGFDKKFIRSGGKSVYEVELDSDAFSYYNVEKHDFILDKGKYEILVGTSSDDIRLVKTIKIN